MQRIGDTSYESDLALAVDMTGELYNRMPERVRECVEDVGCIGIVGVGGVGTWVAIAAAMSGVRNIHVWDDDKLEESNLSRLPYAIDAVGSEKTEALARVIAAMNPGCVFVTHGRVAPETIDTIEIARLVFDCTDNTVVQNTIREYCKSISLQYVKLGYDGMEMSISGGYAEAWGDEETQGYQTPSSFVASAATVGILGFLMGIEKYGSGKAEDYSFAINLNDIVSSVNMSYMQEIRTSAEKYENARRFMRTGILSFGNSSTIRSALGYPNSGHVVESYNTHNRITTMTINGNRISLPNNMRHSLAGFLTACINEYARGSEQ